MNYDFGQAKHFQKYKERRNKGKLQTEYSLELSILIYTVSSENKRKLLVGLKNWNYNFTLSPMDFIIYCSGNSSPLN